MATSMDVDIDFKTQFFNLEGLRYGERKKNFNKLLNSTDRHVLAQQLDMQPRNYLEKIFYVDILIKLKHIDKLVEILKEGNGVLTSRTLKQKWFFEQAFTTMNEDTIVNEFLPTLSYSMRMKVLKKLALSLNEERMDKIFDCVVQRYGIFLAKPFLFSCSSAKIIEVFKKNKLTLSVEQLKRLLDRDSNLVKFYLEEHRKYAENKREYDHFLSYLVWKNPDLYFEFISESDYNCSVQLGRHTTKAVLKINKEEALKNFDKISRRFNIGAVTREVKDFDKEYLYKLFPEDMNRITSYSFWVPFRDYLKSYPLKNRWSTFANAFQKTYNEDLENHLELIDERIISILPQAIRQKWAEIKYSHTNDFSFVKYFEPKKAFALSKEKINVTSDIYGRCEILKDLVRLCHSNKDSVTYEEVLKYIYIRHRNEDQSSRSSILSIIENHIDYELSTEGLWKHINDLIDVIRVKGEPLPFGNITKHLIFLFKKKLPVDEAITLYFKDILNQKTGITWNFSHYLDQEPQIKAEIMKHLLIKCLHTIEPESKRKTLAAALLEEIVNFNEKNAGLWIDINESTVVAGYIKDIFDKKQVSDENDVIFIKNLIKNNYSRSSQTTLKVYEDNQLLALVETVCVKGTWEASRLSSVLLDTIKKPRTSEFQNDLLEYYFARYNFGQLCPNRREAIEYFLAEEPEVLAKYFDHILPIEVDSSLLNYSILKLYSHLGLDEKLINHFKPLVSASSACESKIKLIQKLSKIMPTEDFINLMSVYIPQKAKLDLMDPDEKCLYEAQCAVAKALANLDEVTKLIPLLYPFCQGDYLQSSVPLLYKVLYRIGEEQALSFIHVLMDRAVSARKHAVYLGSALLSQKDSMELFNVITTKEKNVSAKKYVLQGVLKYFLKNPLESLLEMVVTSLASIDKNDTELLDTLIESAGKVSDEFKPTFAAHLWDFLEVIEKKEVFVTTHRLQLLGLINEFDVNCFFKERESFCQNVISKYFLCNDDTIENSGKMNDFVAKYLLAYTDDKHFEFVFDFVKKYKGLHWERHDKNKLRHIFGFLRRIFDEHIDKNIEFWKLFKTHWELLFNHVETFSEYVLLSLVILYKKTSNIGAFSAEVSRSFQELVVEYGPYISDILVECVKAVLQNGKIKDKTFSMTNFALQLLTVDKNDLNCFIACSFISITSSSIDEQIRSRVISVLKSVDNVAVRIRCNNLLKK